MFHHAPATLRTALLGAAFLLSTAAPALAGPPTDFLKKSSGEVNQLLREKDSPARQQKFSQKLNATVDFRELAARALGKYWEEQPPENQQEFLDLLQQLLEANYRDKLIGKRLDEDYTIDYRDERTSGNLAVVDTRVKWDKHSKPVSYKLIKKEADWVVFDIVIDDISLLETYRDSYTNIIRKKGWDELIKRMQKKVAEEEAHAKKNAAAK